MIITRIARGAGRRQRLVGDAFWPRLLDRLPVMTYSNKPRPIRSVGTGLSGQAPIDLQPAVVAAGESMGLGLADPGAVEAGEGVVSAVCLQRDRRLRVPHRGLGPAGVRADTGGGVEAGELPYIGVGGRVEDLLGPADRLEPLHEQSQHGGVGGDRHGGDEVGPIDGPPEPGRRLANSVSTQSSATRWRGPCQMSQWATAWAGEVGGVAIPYIVVVPLAANWSAANWRIVSNNPYRVWPGTLLDGDQRLAHQRVQQVQHRVLVLSAPAHRDRSGGVEPVGEHRTAAQHVPLVGVEQVERPLHRLTQRLMPFQPAP